MYSYDEKRKHREAYSAPCIGGSPAQPDKGWPIQQNGKNRNDTNASWAQTLASPLGEEGHEVAKGCWRVRIGKKLKVEQAAYRRSRPRWSVTSALGPVHPMAPQGATRVGSEKSLRHTLLVPFRRHPLWWLAPPPSPRFAVGRWVLGGVPHDFNGKRREAYSVPCIGESPAQPDKGVRPAWV